MHADSEILQFIRERLVLRYGESENLDYIHNLDRIIQEQKEKEGQIREGGTCL
jgi:hypothetical protein